MLLDLPITNVRLQACHEDWQHMTPTEQGRHCQRCDRVVIDFTQSSTAELATAQAAAPDGRVCGRFRAEQLAAVQPLRPRPKLRLRGFLMAAVLVLVQGLTAGQAWAQVCGQRVPFRAAGVAPLYQVPGSWPLDAVPPLDLDGLIRNVSATPDTMSEGWLGVVVEHMPEFPGGLDAMIRFLKANIHYPKTTAEGKVFVNFVVQPDGRIRDAQVLKGAHPLLNAEALRVVHLMPAWKPGTQNGRAVNISYTIPITFSLTNDAPLQPPPSRKRRR